MKSSNRIKGNGITIETTIPGYSLLNMSIDIRENEHTKAQVELLIIPGSHSTVVSNNFVGDDIRIFDEEQTFFIGLIEKMELLVEGGITKAVAFAVSRSILMDKEKKKRSFQNIEMTYEYLIEKLVKKYGKNYFISDELKKKINNPIIQYEETDWEFLKRLATHHHTAIYPECQSLALFSLGIKKGKIKSQLNRKDIFFCYGISDNYYLEGGFTNRRNREEWEYLCLQRKENWTIGDIVTIDRASYTVYRKQIVFNRGEITYIYLVGGTQFIYQKRKENDKLAGITIKGTVRGVERENVFLQLEFDEEEEAMYPWPWRPVTGNMCYCMPEKFSQAMLYFPRGEEKDGIAVNILYQNQNISQYDNIEKRELHTLGDKKIGLYMDEILLAGKEEATQISMVDNKSSSLVTHKNINFSAKEGIYLTGKNFIASAPLEVICRTDKSNIEISRDFNFYAPEGVQILGKDDKEVEKFPSVGQAKEVNHWQMSFSALAAIPLISYTNVNEDGVIDLMAAGAIPQIVEGKTVLALKDVMAGEKECKIRYASSLNSMEIYTVKGGYALP